MTDTRVGRRRKRKGGTGGSAERSWSELIVRECCGESGSESTSAVVFSEASKVGERIRRQRSQLRGNMRRPAAMPTAYVFRYLFRQVCATYS